MLMPVIIDCTTAPETITGSTQNSAVNDLTNGLLATNASIAPKYFYNVLGSKLFEAITLLDEYYPTRTEAAIFEAHYSDIAQAIGQAGISNACLIDLGEAIAPSQLH